MSGVRIQYNWLSVPMRYFAESQANQKANQEATQLAYICVWLTNGERVTSQRVAGQRDLANEFRSELVELLKFLEATRFFKRFFS